MLDLALTALIEQTKKKRFGAGTGRGRKRRRPAATGAALLAPAPVSAGEMQLAPAPIDGDPPPADSSRYIPADVRSAVYGRDGGQCTFVSEDGHRCQETRYVQVDHVEMYCRGVEPTVANTRLLCSSHNRHEVR